MAVASVGVGKMMQKGKLSYGIHEFIFRPMTPEASCELYVCIVCQNKFTVFLDNYVD